jgi:hypothetical protein
MHKVIVLLASSKKYSNLCIAGIDVSTGEWIRIVSEDENIRYAVKETDIIYKDGKIPQIMDIVKIRCKKYMPNYYQTENYVFDNRYPWEKVGRADMDRVLNIYPINNKEYIFYDNDKKIHKDYFTKINDKDKYSLILIKPESTTIHVKQWPERKDVTISFDYKGRSYNYLSITDIDYENRYLKCPQGNYFLGRDVYLVLSLGECYKNYHYKLVTTIIIK